MQRLSDAGWKAWASLVVTVSIWAAFLVVTRSAMTSQLGVTEVGLIRYATGAVLFLPILLRRGFVPPGAGWREVLLIPLFGGVFFILLLGSGLRIAPVADSGVFTPSMLPLYVALLSSILLGEVFTRLRLVGFALIVIGAISVGGWVALVEGEPGVWRGHLMFTAASFSWAVYTVLFRRSGMSALDAGALLCFWSTLWFLGLALLIGVDFTTVPTETLIIQMIFQGVLSGFVATFTFFYAVSTLGASRTAAFAALVPVLAALGGWLFLDEAIGPVKALGIVIVSVGVALASGAVTGRKRIGQN